MKDEVGMGVACVTMRMYLRKGRYVGNLQWDIMRKFPTEWANLYGAWVLGLGDTIYSRYGKCLQKPWFGKFMRGETFRMGVINR